MAYKERSGTGVAPKTPTAVRLYHLQSPEIARTLSELRAKYGRYALPDAKLRQMMDKALGSKTLTEELYAMREGR